MMRVLSVLSLLACLGALGCAQGDWRQPAPAQYLAVTPDDWAISIKRFSPPKLDPRKAPVILCHGLSYNAEFYDLTAETSLARYLCDAGYDVWVPSLRGAGWSTKPPVSRLRQLFRGDLYTAGGVFTSAGRGMLKVNWTVDDHIQYDVPAILDLVLRETGRPQAHWVGHSMGGMILAGHLAGRPDDPRLASFVALGVPVYVEQPLSKPMAMIADGKEAFAVGNALISTNLPALLGVLGGTAMQTPVDVLFYNKANVADATVRALAAVATEDISPGQLGQLVDMIRTGVFHSADGKTEYPAALGKARTPALFCVGTVDNLATPGAVRQLYRQWGGPTKRFALFGAVNGQQADYGHDDLVIGRAAKQEVYPTIRLWLDERSGLVVDTPLGPMPDLRAALSTSLPFLSASQPAK